MSRNYRNSIREQLKTVTGRKGIYLKAVGMTTIRTEQLNKRK